MSSSTIVLEDYIRDVPDFPKPGIMFKDITPLLSSPDAFARSTEMFVQRYKEMEIDKIVAAEARGFIFGTPLAQAIQKPFVPIRKPGKLPYEVVRYEYELEYGTDVLEMHTDAVSKGDRVLIVDDLLATGGTVGACRAMIEQLGATVVECAFVIELEFLNGREKIEPAPCFSLVKY